MVTCKMKNIPNALKGQCIFFIAKNMLYSIKYVYSNILTAQMCFNELPFCLI